MSDHEVFKDGRLHVCERKCATCIFRPGNLMRLEEGRKEGIARDAVAEQSVIPCHKTIYGQAEQPAVCRGYWDVHKNDVQGLQVAERLGLVKEIDPDGMS